MQWYIQLAAKMLTEKLASFNMPERERILLYAKCCEEIERAISHLLKILKQETLSFEIACHMVEHLNRWCNNPENILKLNSTGELNKITAPPFRLLETLVIPNVITATKMVLDHDQFNLHTADWFLSSPKKNNNALKKLKKLELEFFAGIGYKGLVKPKDLKLLVFDSTYTNSEIIQDFQKHAQSENSEGTFVSKTEEESDFIYLPKNKSRPKTDEEKNSTYLEFQEKKNV